jgi:HEAT repeat protein
MRLIFAKFGAMLGVALVFAAAVAQEQPPKDAPPARAKYDPHAETLRLAGLEPTQASLSKYLLSLIPNEENIKQQKKLIDDLGNSSFAVREAAEASLATTPNPPLDLLRAAAESCDPEVRFRAREVLKQVEGGKSTATPHAVFGTIELHEIPGLAFAVMQYMPYWDDASRGYIARRALLATVTGDDVELLRRALTKKPPERRAAAVVALAKILKDKAAGDLVKALADDAEEVRLAAAEALANLGRRESLDVLVALLASPESRIRHRAGQVLQSVTRAPLTFTAYDSQEKRTASMEAWRTWLADNGRDAKLHFPLAPVEVFLGRTLMSLYPSALREIDAEGNTIFEKEGFTYAWGCHATSDGMRVFCDYSGKYLIEYDAEGNEVWRKNDLPGPPSDCRRLDDGRVLLSLSDSQKVVEIDHKGEVVWSVALEGRPTCAERLPNGNTLVNLQFGKRVVEVDRDGKVVWELKGIDNALTAQGLPNGNVLVCEMNLGKAVEYDRAGKVVWKREGFSNACQAQRLPSGNTLVSDASGLHEITPAGEEVWSLRVPRGRFWRY